MTFNMATCEEDFEVEKILDDKVDAGTSHYLVRWKRTATKNIQHYLTRYRPEIKHVIKINDSYILVWKDSWMPANALQETCDELLGAYLLLKLYNYHV